MQQFSECNRNSEIKPKQVLAVVTAGGFTHAAPVLEICKVLAGRGYAISFATNSGQEHWTTDYPFISQIYVLVPAPTDEETPAHYKRMLNWNPSTGLAPIMESKYLWDNPISRPGFIIADFFTEAAVKDMMFEFGIPIAVVWPQMPYLVAPVSYIPGQPGFQIDMSLASEHASLLSRIRNETVVFWALPSLIKWMLWTRSMRRNAGVYYRTPSDAKPNYLVLVNSFFGLEVPKDLPPTIVPCGPILSDKYPDLDDSLSEFLQKRERVMYISLGTHISLPESELLKILSGALEALEENHIDGVIWAMNDTARTEFPRSTTTSPHSLALADGKDLSTTGDLLDEKHPAFTFPVFAPQRAILDHKNTKFFLTHGGSSSANEALYHGVPMLTLGFFFDQLSNSARLLNAGVAVSLDKLTFTSHDVYQEIKNIITDEGGRFGRDVGRMKHIARISSRRKGLAGDLIEMAMVDEELRFDGKGGEVHPRYLQTADMRMSVWRAGNWDLCLMTVGFGVTVITGFALLGRSISKFRFFNASD